MNPNIFVDQRERLDGATEPGFALYIDGDFQFDTADEAIYHQYLALPALALARSRTANDLKVLICGGGDGLALRECLRFPGVSSVDLVDYSEDVVELGRTLFDQVNCGAFSDARVRVFIEDAWDFLQAAHGYDVVICDFTVPRRPEDTRVFSAEWYGLLKLSLGARAVLAINGVSPQTTPLAFWCLAKTVKSAGFNPMPYRVCIPSFRDHGYGVWAFMLCSQENFRASDLKALSIPIESCLVDLKSLARAARFSASERGLMRHVPINNCGNAALLPLLLNPTLATQTSDEPQEASPYDLNPLLNSIPISHPYHTRVMIETLADQIVGTVRELDIRRLLDAVLKRAKELPESVITELNRLRSFLRDHAFRFELFSAWSYKLFATLVIMMTLANAIAPDNAFAKGSFGGGSHGGVSVSHSSFGARAGFGAPESGSFSGARGFSAGGRQSSSSFGGARGTATGRANGGFSASHSVLSGPSSPTFTSSGFRTAYGRGHAVDIYGTYEPARVYSYCGSGYGHVHPYTSVGGGNPNMAPPEKHEALFLASEDMSVLDNGDVVINVSDNAFLLLTNGTVALMSQDSPNPVISLYPDPSLFANGRDQIARQQDSVQNAIVARREWLSWVGWTSWFMPAVAGDMQELRNLQDLSSKLDVAMQRLGNPPAGVIPTDLHPDDLELFIDARLTASGAIQMRDASGAWMTFDAGQISGGSINGVRQAPPQLQKVVRSALLQMRKDTSGGIASDQNDLQLLANDSRSLYRDLNDYSNLQSMNYGDPYYQVDYGTEEISVIEALRRTNRDIRQNEADTNATMKDIDRLNLHLNRIDAALSRIAG